MPTNGHLPDLLEGLEIHFSFQPLLTWWETELAIRSPLWKNVWDQVAGPKSLANPDWVTWSGVTPPKDIDAGVYDTWMAPIWPAGLSQNEPRGLIAPFNFQLLHATVTMWELWDQELHFLEDGESDSEMTLNMVYCVLISQVYQLDLIKNGPPSMVFYVEKDGRRRYFQGLLDVSWLRFRAKGKPPLLTEEYKAFLKENPLDLAWLKKHIPLKHFIVEGFTLMSGVEITREVLISELRLALLNKDTLITRSGLLGLRAKLRFLLDLPDLNLSLAALQKGGVQVRYAMDDAEMAEHGKVDEVRTISISDFSNSVYERSILENSPQVIGNLVAVAQTTKERTMAANGVVSILAAPLSWEGSSIGVIGLSSPRLNAFSPPNVKALKDVLPLLGLALHHSQEDLESRIRARVQEKYTVLHPSVAWKFRDLALRSLSDPAAADEPVVFSSVWPLYAATDIRNSSVNRNSAIQADLLTQLDLAKKFLVSARKAQVLPVLDELLFRVDQNRQRISTGLSTGDEINLHSFFRQDLDDALQTLSGVSQEAKKAADSYWHALDPQLGLIYHRRKEYDDSVRKINTLVEGILEQEQEQAQAMHPHYFDKTSTDGVDFNLYIGPGLAQDRTFHPLHLRNLRLWQLLVLTRIAQATHILKNQLALPLETTHLLVVQDLPITIRFREDEKRFAVDGAYDTRYEILKKRIDKATIKGTGKRLTEIGHLAIVYSQASEAQEYRRYIAFLQSRGLLSTEIEELEIEDLQGIHGLHALRVKVLEGSEALSDESWFAASHTQEFLKEGGKHEV